MTNILTLTQQDLPFNSTIHPTSSAHRETVLFVPFFGGPQKSLKKHVNLVNNLGFNAVTFDLKDRWSQLPSNLISSKGKWGIKNVWTDQIEQLLNKIPGQKIIYSFSNPSWSALHAIALRGGYDISGIICDSGPSGELDKSMFNYFQFERPLPTWPLKYLAAQASAFLWSPRFKESILSDMKLLPPGLRVLSIRGWKDPLITPEMIDRVFEPYPQIAWEKLSIPEAKHLNGLRDHEDIYRPRVESFLNEISQLNKK